MSESMGVVLAAGKGTRMNSDLPKVLFEVCGRPMIHFVLDAMEAAGVKRQVVVVGYRGDEVRRVLADRRSVEFAEQTEQLGTGHAVMMCQEQIRQHTGAVMILAGDSPLAQKTSLSHLLTTYRADHPACILGTLHREDPTGLGRIVRNEAGDFQAIVEDKDATPAQQLVTEVNMSTYCFDSHELLWALERLRNDNRQNEYYITDCPGILKQAGKDVRASAVLKPCESLSINTIDELRIVESEMRNMGYKG
jgi:bifunctional UDP-N-acetylglucosamine pyrophosphorylase/glucosamine-1-phosphate N-acetyltransferase/UDP-N-acetylglucosamine pyrophosphorylase